MIQEFEADGSQRDGGADLQGRGNGIRAFVGQIVWGNKACTREISLHHSGLGKVRYLNLVGRGVCRKRL